MIDNMKNLNYLLMLLFLGLTWACSEDEPEPTVDILTSEAECVLGAEVNAKAVVRFNSSHAWKASSNASWAVITPTSGEAGEVSLSILALEENLTGEERTGTLTIQGGGTASANINFTQEAKDVLNVSQTEYALPDEGGEVTIDFETNVAGEVVIAYTEDVDWITEAEAASSRALVSGSFTLNVLPNETRSARTAKLKLRVVEAEQPDKVLFESPTLTISQEAAPVGTSTSFALDKQVTQLLTHTAGNGIPVVIMGDGFLDKDIQSGYYREVMEKTIENFFSEEPLHSLREYFDIWEVTAVSRNNAFGDTYSTAFSGWLEGGGSTLIEGDHNKVMEYAQMVPQLAENAGLFENALCIVVLNTFEYAGTCYFGFSNISGGTTHFAIGYCPTINDLDDDLFRRTLVHECAGHGFTKLLDEYSYQDYGAIPSTEVEKIRNQQTLGWAANVDFTSRPSEVKWSRFLSDPRYQGVDAWGETLSVYQGACTYWSGVYRPTNDSMMRNNQHGFNAPSREAIWKRVMTAAYGEDWTYDYDEFTAFDQAHLPHPADNAQTKAADEGIRMGTPPQFTGMPLQYKR